MSEQGPGYGKWKSAIGGALQPLEVPTGLRDVGGMGPSFVRSGMGELEAAIGCLIEAVVNLEQRLGLVLTPEANARPTPASSKEAGSPSNLAVSIWQHAAALQELRRKVDELTMRVDL